MTGGDTIGGKDGESTDPFDEIMEEVGFSGHFQRMYNGIFILGLSCFGAMIYMNIILALNVPDHWCNVPGRENTNFTLDSWRDLTLPRQADNRGVETHSKCQMYNKNFTDYPISMMHPLNATDADVIDFVTHPATTTNLSFHSQTMQLLL